MDIRVVSDMKTVILFLLFYMTAEGLAQGPTVAAGCEVGDAARTLCEMELRLTEALRRNDADALSRIYADEFHLVNFRGTRVDKAAVLRALREGRLRFDSLVVSELHVRVYGDLGIISGRQNQVAREPGPDATPHPKIVRFTHVYVRREGTWQLIASQITPILPRP